MRKENGEMTDLLCELGEVDKRIAILLVPGR
jgi:hypothetical protein